MISRIVLPQGGRVRLILVKLVILFVLAHPGSAATFANTQDFLLSRYPNRDVLPSSSLVQQQQGRRPEAVKATSRRATSHYTPSSPYLFVKVPVPTLAPLDLSVTLPITPNVAMETSRPRPGTSVGAGRPAGCPSPSRRRSSVLQVVVGDFISSLEEAKSDARGSFNQEDMTFLRAKMAPTTGAAPAALQTAGGVGVLTMSSPEEVVMRPMAGHHEGHNRVWGAVEGLMRFSGSTLVGAYDNVMGFVESKLVQNNKTNKALPTLPKFPSIGVGSMRQDLVGFMDLDPFERSRKFHKRAKFM